MLGDAAPLRACTLGAMRDPFGVNSWQLGATAGTKHSGTLLGALPKPSPPRGWPGSKRRSPQVCGMCACARDPGFLHRTEGSMTILFCTLHLALSDCSVMTQPVFTGAQRAQPLHAQPRAVADCSRPRVPATRVPATAQQAGSTDRRGCGACRAEKRGHGRRPQRRCPETPKRTCWCVSPVPLRAKRGCFASAGGSRLLSLRSQSAPPPPPRQSIPYLQLRRVVVTERLLPRSGGCWSL